ncbi:HAD family hydrolase [Sagittula sp. SSi028]|uniref:HAD family hydrolase n=1 Tax=Sagittula sp. SSi028 TaxID=3400636 RepID=UPI003AF767C3
MHVMHVALGGCLTAPPVRYGLTEDTGGHIAYVLGAAMAQAARPDIDRVSIVTRGFDDPQLGAGFAAAEEQVCDKCHILRLRSDSAAYLEKDALFAELPALGRALIALVDGMGRERPDVIHAHFADAASLAFDVRARFGIPVIYTAHSLAAEKLQPGETATGALAARIARERRAIQQADAIIASSRDEVERQLPNLDPAAEGKTHRIAPGVMLEASGDADRATEFLAPFLRDPQKPVILAIARPIAKKNLAGLLRAYASDPVLQERCNLVIVAGLRQGITAGAAQDAIITELFDLVDRNDLWGKVALPREHSSRDVADLYALAARGGVFCNPALHEPFGLTLIEAAKSGVPIVATHSGGPSDILPELGFGELVDPRDDRSIAQGLRRSLESPARDTRAQTARLVAERVYDWDTWAAQSLPMMRRLRAAQRSTVAGHADFLLACDIDNTLTGCGPSASRFARWLAQEDRQSGFVVATGRSVAEARRILSEWHLPEPDTIISSTGTEIWRRHGHQYQLCGDYAAHVSAGWSAQEVRRALQDSGAQFQPVYDQRRWKISLFGTQTDAQRIETRLAQAGLAVRVVASHGRFIDLLPPFAGKAAAIGFEAARRGLPDSAVTVAGDSGNDRDMLETFGQAILPSNALAELDTLAQGYRSRSAHAAGVLDGLNHFRVGQTPLLLAGE